MGEKKLLLLIDGHALAYRAYHAIPPLSSPSGEPTNAAFGFVNMLLKAIQDYAPDYVVATFDSGRTFRHEEYEGYKATRVETPDDLRAQFGRIQELTKALGIPVQQKERYEADDLLGTLSKQASQQGLETIILSGDSDTFQLISTDVRVLTPRRTFGEVQLYDMAAVRDRYGLDPGQLVDLKAIVGDPSDNVPGVTGVGIKTATRLMKQYGSLEAVYQHLDEVKETRFRTALEAGRDSATMSKELVTIVRDVDVSLDLEGSKWGEFDRDRIMGLLRELGFHSLAARIPGAVGTETEQLGLFDRQDSVDEPSQGLGDYTVVDTLEDLRMLALRLANAPRFALDTETTGTDAMRASLVGISVSDIPGEAFYIPIGHVRRVGEAPQLSLEQVRRHLGPVFADSKSTKVLHNAKFDLMMLLQHGMPVEGACVDTMLAAWLLSPSGRGIGLKEQVWQRLGFEMTPIQELIRTRGRKPITMKQVSIAKAAPYACADADMTLRLSDLLRPELEVRDQWRLFWDMEMPLVAVLASMEMHGMVLDTVYLAKMSSDLAGRLAELEDMIYDHVGHPFNLKSTQQLAVVLFEELALPVVRRTRTGYSTDVGVLEELKDKHPVVNLVLEYRQLEKLKSTYLDALPALVNPKTGRVHTSFHQVGTSTGRLSSSDPNLQNIPVRTELGRGVRRAFVAPEDHVLLACDYSQVELRLLAHFSKDPELMGAFHRGEDVHASTAAAIHGIPISEVTYEQRSLAKAINFGLMYGMSGYGLARRTSLSVPEAEHFIEAYFGRFGRVREFLDETIREANRQGYVATIMGRRRYFPELGSSGGANSRLRRAAERAAVNMPIQGSAADIIKIAMIELYHRLRQVGLSGYMVLQVHDELVLEVPESELQATRALVVDTMENAYRLEVPLRVDAAVGKNWMEMN